MSNIINFDGKVVSTKAMKRILSHASNKEIGKQLALIRDYIFHEMSSTCEICQCVLMGYSGEGKHVADFYDATEAELYYNEIYLHESEIVDNLGTTILLLTHSIKEYLTENFKQKEFSIDISVSYINWFMRLIKKGNITAHFRVYRASEYPIPDSSDLDNIKQPMLYVVFKT